MCRERGESGYVQQECVIGSRESNRRLLYKAEGAAGRYGQAWVNEYLYGPPDNKYSDDLMDDEFMDDYHQDETDL